MELSRPRCCWIFMGNSSPQVWEFPQVWISQASDDDNSLFIACIGNLFITFALPGSLYAASIIIGLSFGSQWRRLSAAVSEIFGLTYYATLHNLGAVASPLGAYLLSMRVAGYLYNREAGR